MAINFLRSLSALSLLAGLTGWAILPRAALANAEMDRKYSLETIGALRAWDNVDGLFADYVGSAYKDYFSRQTRFRMQDLSKADTLLTTSKISYAKAIEDPEILGQLSRSFKSQSLLRTRIVKEGPRYRFTVDWLHAPQMDVLATETFTLEDTGGSGNGAVSDGSEAHDFAGLGDIKGRLQAALDRMFAKVPFVGQVTGRDNDDITVNLGTATGIKRGDTLMIGTIEEVKKHPLLKEIVEWRINPVGKIEVDSVDEALAFGHVVAQEEGHEISRYQKITQVIHKVDTTAETASAEKHDVSVVEVPPKLGFGMASLWTGGYSRQYSSQTTSFSGGGFLYGARGSGEVWLNREFFVDLDLGYGAFSYSQNNSSGNPTPAGSVGGSVFTLNLDLGYTYLITGDFFGPRGWIKAGYRIASYTLPTSATESTEPFGIKSLYLGIGGDIPIRDGYGADIELDFGVFNGGSQTGGNDGDVSSAHDAVIYVGGYYRYKPRINFRLGFEIQGNGADFSSNSASVSQKTMALMPSVEYLF